MLRNQLQHIAGFIYTCRRRDSLLELLGDYDYMLTSDDLFSVIVLLPRPVLC